MRTPSTLMVAGVLLLPLQAAAQGGGSTTGTGTATAPGIATPPTGTPNAAMPGPPGTNDLGTAQSSGRSVTTGSASASSPVDARIRAEDSRIDKKLRSICRGC